MPAKWNSRIAVRARRDEAAVIHLAERIAAPCRLRNTSATGALLAYAGPLPPEFDLTLTGKGRLRARIRWRSGSNAGVMFIAART